MGRIFQKPEIEYGHPLPPARKKVDRRCIKRPSGWYAFLNELPVATASFQVEWCQLQAVRNAAKAMGIEIEYQDTKVCGPRGLRLARIWRRT